MRKTLQIMALRLRLIFSNRSLSYRCYSIPLLSGNKWNYTNKVLAPYIDIASKMDELPKLQGNIELRKLKIDPIKLKSLWDFFKHLEATRNQLEKRKIQISDHLKDLKKFDDEIEARKEIEKLKLEARIVREDLKTLQKAFWEVEEKVSLNCLLLPNELHVSTPGDEEKVIHEFGQRPHVNTPANHIDVGMNLNLIDYKDPSCFFLKNQAALFEISCAYFFADDLKKNDFISFCNPDFSRSVIVDSCKTNFPTFVIKEKHDREISNYKLHLVGGASMYPFCAFHTKQTVCFSSLPLKYFTMGRQYSPSSLDSRHGLYETWQRTTNELFILTPDDYNEMMSIFEQTLAMLIKLYQKLNYHFRVVYLNASSLESWESLRASFQMYSCQEGKYIEIGKISLSDSYICERLLMTYQMSDKDRKKRFMKIISGTAVDVTKLLACILEQKDYSNEKFVMPECLKSHWSI